MTRNPLVRQLILAAAVALAPMAAQALEVIVSHRGLSQSQDSAIGRITLTDVATMRADDENFGGFSALTRHEGGLLAVTDRGYWLAFDWDGANDVHVRRWEPTPIDESALLGRGSAVDAEEAITLRDGSILISFEREHRLQQHRTLDADPITWEVPIALRRPAPLNFGIEAMTLLEDGSVFAVTEKVKRDGGFRAYRISGDRGQRRQLFTYQVDGDWLPSAAVPLPTGDILLVERHLVFYGFKTRLVLLERAQLEQTADRAPITVTPLIEFGIASQARANIEGLVIDVLDDGSWQLTGITDDNFEPLLANKLLRFRIDPNG